MKRHRGVGVLMAVALAALALSGPAAAQPGPSPGQRNSITDVPGLQVGQYNRTDGGYLTGTTVILATEGAVGGVDVRGGAPGTRETDLLDPRNLVQEVNAVVLSGGSAYGLDAAHGTMEWLEEQGMGYPVGFQPHQVVPIVPSAILFDLGRGGRFNARPDHEFGYKAADAASGGAVAQGNVGAGTGAVAGGIKGGIGTASVDLGNGITIAAIVAVNAVGRTFNPDTCELYAAYLEMDDEFGDYSAPTQEDCQTAGFGGGGGSASSSSEADQIQSMNTTIGVVATNLPLTKAQLQKMAGVAHDGLARSIRPLHTMFDGDSVFALSTGEGQITSECQTAAVFPVDAVCTLLLNDVFSAGADALARAVAHATLNAESTHGFTSYCDTFPSACDGSRDGDSGAAPPGGSDRTGRDTGPGDGAPADAPQRSSVPVGVPDAGLPDRVLAATGLHGAALALLALTSLAVGAALLRQRRAAVIPSAVRPEPGY